MMLSTRRCLCHLRPPARVQPHASALHLHQGSHLAHRQQQQRRSMSVFDSVVSSVETGLMAYKAGSHLPWWAVVGSSAAAMRLLVLLPAAVKSEEFRSRLELLGPTIAEWTDALRFKVYARCRKEGKTQEEADKLLQREIKAKHSELLNAHDLQRWKVLGVSFAPIPLWLIMSLGVRQLCLTGGVADDGIAALMKLEGLPWCLDLTMQDTTMILPVALCLSNLVNVQLQYLMRPRPKHSVRTVHRPAKHADQQQPPGKRPRPGEPQFPILLTSLSILMLPIYAALPSGLVFYWLVSSSSTVIQSISLRHPRVRRALGLPKAPSETASPLKLVGQNAKRDWRMFWQEVQEKNFSNNNSK
eukprot:m.88785 g.88785  ORF g.88785 m.88785 type:complete len:358 (-) comp14550_c0_seq2:151-1224(-)